MNAVVFSPTGHTIATSSRDGTARVWALDGELLAELPHHSPVLSVAFGGGEGAVVGTGLEDHSVGVWDWAAAREQARLWGHTRAVTSVRFSPDDGKVWNGWTNGRYKYYHVWANLR